jgi:hypothetical protein
LTTPTISDLTPGVIVQGPILLEPVEVLATVSVDSSIKLIRTGLHTGQLRDPIRSAEQVAPLTCTPRNGPSIATRSTSGSASKRTGLGWPRNTIPTSPSRQAEPRSGTKNGSALAHLVEMREQAYDSEDLVAATACGISRCVSRGVTTTALRGVGSLSRVRSHLSPRTEVDAGPWITCSWTRTAARRWLS